MDLICCGSFEELRELWNRLSGLLRRLLAGTSRAEEAVVAADRAPDVSARRSPTPPARCQEGVSKGAAGSGTQAAIPLGE